MAHDITKDTFCIYCQEDHAKPEKLQRHIRQAHPGTYADTSLKEKGK